MEVPGRVVRRRGAARQAVRSGAGLFDFSFLAHLVLRGPDGPPLLQRVVTSDVARLAVGAALSSPIGSETKVGQGMKPTA